MVARRKKNEKPLDEQNTVKFKEAEVTKQEENIRNRDYWKTVTVATRTFPEL